MKTIFQFILFSNLVSSQGWYNHPELDWQTIETEHFLIHYHTETKRSAEEAAAVAEKIYKPVTSFYDFEPDTKTHLIIEDVDDISNGAAYYYDNKILIWALPLDFDLRGSHRWLNNVITHEFTHIVQIGASMKYPRRLPASFFQFLNYEHEKREDVLYGYPNILMSYPLPGVSVPPWLAEGTAQFMYPGANFDFWDSHRDMIVRDRILHDNLLPFEAMNAFGKRGIGNESTYNQGFMFCSWMVEQYEVEVLKNITKSISNPMNYSINHAIRDATGIWGHVLYDMWKNELNLRYSKKTAHILENEEKGTVLISGGTTNIHPVWSPDEKRFAYLSNQEHDNFGQTDLFFYDFSDSISQKIAAGVHTAPSWINDSTIIYTKRSKPNKWGSKFFDLYIYTFNDEEEERVTHDGRLISPIYNSASNQLAAITTYDGTSNIMLSSDLDLEIGNVEFQPITQLDNGMQMLSLSWIEEDLFVDAVYHQGRQIYRVVMETGELFSVTSDRWDNRDQVKSPQGMIYAKDQSGIFNLVLQKDDNETYITNVTGGAFMPSVSSDGRILFSLFEDSRYNIAILDSIQIVPTKMVGYETDYFDQDIVSELILGEKMPSRPYEEKMLSMSILPKIMIDYETVKPGFYFFSNEVIDRFSIFGGISANRLWDIDVFLMLEYMKYRPTFYTNLFWISRHRDADRNEPFLYPRVDGSEVDNIHIFNDLAFNLFSVDIGSRFAIGLHKYKLQYNYSNYRQHVKQNVYQYYSYNGEDNTIWRYGELGFDYFRGKSVSIIYDLDLRKRGYVMNMLPGNGSIIHGNIAYEWNQFMDGFSVSEEHSTFGANFISHNTFRITAKAERHFTLNREKKIVASLSASGGGLSNPEVDDFFHFFGGGLPGVRGYTFYDSTLTGPYYFIGTGKIVQDSQSDTNYEKQKIGMFLGFQFKTPWLKKDGGISLLTEFDGMGLNVGLHIPLLKLYQINFSITHFENFGDFATEDKKPPDYDSLQWNAPGITLGLTMNIPRLYNRNRDRGISNYSMDRSIYSKTDSSILFYNPICKEVVETLRDSIRVGNNLIENLTAYNIMLLHQETMLVDSIRKNIFREEVSQSKKNKAMRHLSRSLRFFYDGRYRDALSEVNTALEEDPQFAIAYGRRGSIYYKLGDIRRATLNWNAALQLDPEFTEIYDMLKASDENRLKSVEISKNLGEN